MIMRASVSCWSGFKLAIRWEKARRRLPGLLPWKGCVPQFLPLVEVALRYPALKGSIRSYRQDQHSRFAIYCASEIRIDLVAEDQILLEFLTHLAWMSVWCNCPGAKDEEGA